MYSTLAALGGEEAFVRQQDGPWTWPLCALVLCSALPVEIILPLQGPSPEWSSLLRLTPSVKNIFPSCGLLQPFLLWRAQGGLYDSD